MSPFIEALLENDDDYTVKQNGDTVTFTPLDSSEASLEAFQETAEKLIANEGDGYEINAEPRLNREHNMEYVDRVVVLLDD